MLISPSAYDTGWVASIPKDRHLNKPLFPKCLQWVLCNQHKDGSWGAINEYYHDRIICTLSCLRTLQQYSIAPTLQIKARNYIVRAFKSIDYQNHETLGFELLVPLFLDFLRIEIPPKYLAFLKKMNQSKVALLSQASTLGNSHNSSIYSLEAHVIKRDTANKNLHLPLEINGSAGCSPAATAAYLIHCGMTNDKTCTSMRRYLAQSLHKDGCTGTAVPIDNFDLLWRQYYRHLCKKTDRAAVELIYSRWSNKGMAWSSLFSVPDLDESSIGHLLLALNGRALDTGYIDQYEKRHSFACYQFERNPSLSTNIHLFHLTELLASSRAKIWRKKAYNFIFRTYKDSKQPCDKWHLSWLYPASHMLIALGQTRNGLSKIITSRILRAASKQFTWGNYGTNAEETAYAIIALFYSNPWLNNAIKRRIISSHSLHTLLQNGLNNLSQPELWLGKSLYCPILVVHDTIKTAQLLLSRYVKYTY